jgi:low affinity Fe/Cu permease
MAANTPGTPAGGAASVQTASRTVPSPPASPAAGARWEGAFDRFSSGVTRWAGSSWGFITALSSLLVWVIAGPLAHFSTSWQLIVNTGTTIVTFLMVFLIQRAQNRDSVAIQLKLDELILAMGGASNLMVDIEKLPAKELEELGRRVKLVAERLQRSMDATSSHSIAEADTP